MAKEMLINVSEGEECRIALLDNGKLEELYMERTSATSHVATIYKGRVTNVEPSIQAAFVDFGLGRNGFLHISDLMPTYFGRKGEDIQESVGRKMARRDRAPPPRTPPPPPPRRSSAASAAATRSSFRSSRKASAPRGRRFPPTCLS